jgi:uncharacterized protein
MESFAPLPSLAGGVLIGLAAGAVLLFNGKIGAIGVYLPLQRFASKRGTTPGGDPLVLPAKKGIDVRLLGGAAVFGVGWGVSGFCPGPALTAAAAGSGPAIVFVLAMIAGMALYRVSDRRGQRSDG